MHVAFRVLGSLLAVIAVGFFTISSYMMYESYNTYVHGTGAILGFTEYSDLIRTSFVLTAILGSLLNAIMAVFCIVATVTVWTHE